MKVKKFRIKPRLPVVGRLLKSFLSTKIIPPELESSLPLEIQNFTSLLSPAALYRTWHQGEIPEVLEKIVSESQQEKTIAVSVVAATVGVKLEEKISEFLLKGETNRSQVLAAIGEEAADLALHFIHRLLIDDAQGDDCELSEPISIPENESLQQALSLLDTFQQEVKVDAAGHLSPRFTRVVLVAWRPASKKKRIAVLSKKR